MRLANQPMIRARRIALRPVESGESGSRRTQCGLDIFERIGDFIRQRFALRAVEHVLKSPLGKLRTTTETLP
jgi:hypothetical protein